MTSLRSAKASDLFRMSLCNLDPLVENYDVSFYNHYLATWPKLFIVIEDRHGNIIAYGTSYPSARSCHVWHLREQRPSCADVGGTMSNACTSLRQDLLTYPPAYLPIYLPTHALTGAQ